MQYSKPLLRAGRKAAPSGGVFPSQRMERSSSPDPPARWFKAGLKIEIRANFARLATPKQLKKRYLFSF